MNYNNSITSAPIGALRRALPYLRLFQGKTFVIKVGGSLFDDEDAFCSFIEQVAVLHQLKINVVLVHGGGPQTTRAAAALDIESKFVHGRRVTSPALLEVATKVMNGELSTRVVAAFREVGVRAVGISGVDGGLVVAEKRPLQTIDGDDVDFGEVGDLVATDATILTQLTSADFLPVMSPLSAAPDGRVLNVNADTIAARLASDMKAVKLIFATGAAGILGKPDLPESLHSFLDLDELAKLEEDGTVHSGMKPKTTAARFAINHGVNRVHIVSAHLGDALLKEVFTNEGSGTLIVKDKSIDA